MARFYLKYFHELRQTDVPLFVLGGGFQGIARSDWILDNYVTAETLCCFRPLFGRLSAPDSCNVDKRE